MRKSDGFTLIELLAVIIILSVIALITIPVIMNIIEKSKKSAFKDSVYGVIKAGELYYTNKLLEPNGVTEDLSFSFPEADGLDIKGTKPTGGSMKINKKGKIELAITNGKYCATKGINDTDVIISNDVKNCIIPISVEDINLSETEITIKTKTTKKINVDFVPSDATNKKLNWESSDETIAKVDSKGNITGVSEGITTIIVTVDNTEIKKTITVAVETNIYKDEVLNGADPTLKMSMIPVTIENDGTVKKANLSSKWYDYGSKKWANAVLVTDASRSKYESSDTTIQINENDILAYLVWIPRYKYKLWYVESLDSQTNQDTSKVHSIDIVFENQNTVKSKGTKNGEYLTHPAFTFGSDELNGIWVGKFESGYEGAVSTADAQKDVVNTNKLIIKPNIYSWSKINVSNAYNTIKGMNKTNNIFGLSTDSDTHMMKNTEWGAVAYLSHSKYGKNSEVYINNCQGTGCGGDTASESSNTTCKNAYGSKIDGIYDQSTTGDISGIFDMSGGLYEYVMGYTTGATTKYGSSGFTAATFPEDKYVDIYTSTVYTQYSKRILGDAMGEMGPFDTSDLGSWYQDESRMLNKNAPWILRGGGRSVKVKAGIFSFASLFGDANANYTFRVVLV